MLSTNFLLKPFEFLILRMYLTVNVKVLSNRNPNSKTIYENFRGYLVHDYLMFTLWSVKHIRDTFFYLKYICNLTLL